MTTMQASPIHDRRLAEALHTLTGDRGNPLDRAVRVRDLDSLVSEIVQSILSVSPFRGPAVTLSPTDTVDNAELESGFYITTASGVLGTLPPGFLPTDVMLLTVEKSSSGTTTQTVKRALSSNGGTWMRRSLSNVFGLWGDPSSAPSFGVATFHGINAASASIKYCGGRRVEVTLPSEVAARIPVTTSAIGAFLHVSADSTASVSGMIHFRTSSTPFNTIRMTGAPLAAMLADLDGTTGTPGDFTVSARVGAIHIENRETGAPTRTYTLQI